MATQAQDLLWYLNAYGCITRATAMVELGIAELSSRILDIERGKADGHKYTVPRKRVTVTARNNRKCKVMEYGRPERL
jgi:hypothetical protein